MRHGFHDTANAVATVIYTHSLARADLDIAGDRALGHYTHEKSSVGCAAGLAMLDVIEEEGPGPNSIARWTSLRWRSVRSGWHRARLDAVS